MAGIVLAGGKSRRMGADKALLPFGGATLIDRVIAVVAGVDPDVLVVADRADRFRLPDSVQVVADLFPDAGPLGGIVTGLSHAAGGYHIVVACDMPRLRADVLRLLLASAEGFDGAVPIVAGRPEPLCAVYGRRCLDPLRALLESGCRAVHRAIESLDLRRISEDTLRGIDPNLACFTNVNDPADWQALLDAQGA